jgi:Domain of unknown function (DUF6457)
VLDRWMTELGELLGVDDEIDQDALLDAAREVALGIERRAAPLTTFMIGLAAGRSGRSVQELTESTVAAARAFSSDSG